VVFFLLLRSSTAVIVNFLYVLSGMEHEGNPAAGGEWETRSAVSYASIASSAERARDRKARLAALQQEQLFSVHEAELDRSRLEHDLRCKQLRVAKEMAVARAELSVYEDNDDMEIPGTAAVTDIAGTYSVNVPASAVQSGTGTVLSTLPSTVVGELSVAVAADVQLFNESLPDLSYHQSYPRTASPVVVSSVSTAPTPTVTQSVNVSAVRVNPPPQIGRGITDVTQPVAVPSTTASSLSTSLEGMLKLSQMPKLEMKVFHGDPLDFQRWLISFEKLIEEMTDDPVRRLHYLGQYTAGDANTLVAGHSLGQTEQDYQNAKAELKKEFGRPYVLARAYIDKIEKWPNIKTNDGDALSRLTIFLTKCKGSMASLRHLQQLNTDLYLQKIVAKLPHAIQREWCKYVGRCEDKNEDIDFGKLVSFVEKQARIVRHPVYSAEALVKVEGETKSHVVREHDKPTSGQKVSSPPDV